MAKCKKGIDIKTAELQKGKYIFVFFVVPCGTTKPTLAKRGIERKERKERRTTGIRVRNHADLIEV